MSTNDSTTAMWTGAPANRVATLTVGDLRPHSVQGIVESMASTATGKRRPAPSAGKAPAAKGRKPAAKPAARGKFANPAPRRPTGLRQRGEGLDVRPKAYNWFGGRKGTTQATMTFKEMAGVRSVARAPSGRPKSNTKRSRKTGGRRSGGALEKRLAALQRELAAIAEEMRTRL